MENLLLPLFPLELVLFPEEPLPLHIFEERYKQMVGECLKAKAESSGQQEFGVVLAQGEGMHTVGCGARIVNLTRKYDDGRMDIFTVGTRRFEILFVHEGDDERLYTRGAVEFFDDEQGADLPSEPDAQRAIELFRQILHRLRKSEEIPIHFPRPYRHLSYRIAAPLPLELDFKQELLPLRNEAERLTRVISAIEALIPKIDLVETVRRKAGGNGHARSAL